MEPDQYGSESDRLKGFCLLGDGRETKQAFAGLGRWLSRQSASCIRTKTGQIPGTHVKSQD